VATAQGATYAAAADASASWYVRRDEQLTRERAALAQAVVGLVRGLCDELNFRDLQLVEMLFYGQMRNNAIAAALGLDEKYVALLKHRWIKQLRAHTVRALAPASELPDPDFREASLLSEVWEEYRPSCPKRSTLGGYVLGTLEPPWADYIRFHTGTLGCRFCNANLDDLRRETTQARDAVRDRVMQSTAGFFRRP
jgi:hypothetical protein